MQLFISKQMTYNNTKAIYNNMWETKDTNK